MARSESPPAGEMIKSVSLLLAGCVLLPSLFTDFLGLLLLLPPIQHLLTMRLLTYLRLQPSSPSASSETFEGGVVVMIFPTTN
ncbi:FxsA family protein [Sodalis-like endosymbiont of Proechinophthirus fluctus]|uniref:FxsA family protein n=1 Tax=Sodalis-like endosymbiont of Proechinophthirus fluctus TaxID=1462730 RepID=UPI003F7511F1